MSGLLIIWVPHLAMIGQWFPIIRHLAREALREAPYVCHVENKYGARERWQWLESWHFDKVIVFGKPENLSSSYGFKDFRAQDSNSTFFALSLR